MEKEIVSQERENFIDVAKAIGIILIVLGHSFSENSHSKIRSFVYLFHVPFFFIISGYFFNDKYIYSIKNYIFRRINTIYIPFIRWSIPFVLLHNFFFKINVYNSIYEFRGHTIPFYSFKDIVKNIFNIFLFKETEQLLGGFWFLPCLFFTTIIFFSIVWIQKKLQARYLLSILSISCFIIGNLLFANNINIPYFTFDLNLYFVTTFLFYLGYLFRKYKHLIRVRFSIMILSLFVLLIINEINHVKIYSIESVLGNTLISCVYLIITPILGSYVIIYISKFLTKSFLSKTLINIGKKTISILALHFLCFKFVSLVIILKRGLPLHNIAQFPVINNSDWWFFAYLSIGVILPFVVIYLLNKFKSFTLESMFKRQLGI